MFLLLPAPIPTGPKRCVNREMDLGSHISELDSLLLQSVTAFGFVDNVFKTFFLTTAETASCRVRTLLRSGWLPSTVILYFNYSVRGGLAWF